ncbi:hypothetical protein [Micromonospora sp. MH33]|uniref:hypothetical protein n=1 Tax=Micromonospora sp. MH33 TaxID=1945509 RepID=UPI000D149381|nr:hypothetical protein [Micromonospora sp. MH33]
MAEFGAGVVIADPDLEGAQRVVKPIEAAGGSADVVRDDGRHPDRCRCAGAVRLRCAVLERRGAGGGVDLPFGGWKGSGVGREKGFERLAGYRQTKAIAVGTP